MSLFMSKCHIFGNHMSWLINVYCTLPFMPGKISEKSLIYEGTCVLWRKGFEITHDQGYSGMLNPKNNVGKLENGVITIYFVYF